MSRDIEHILALYRERKNEAGPMAAKMREVRDVYNGDVVVPLPEREQNEKVAVANLMRMGLDQMADRVASTVPDTKFLVRRGGATEEKRARNKRKAIKGMQDHSEMGLKLYRRGRHLLGYGTSPMLIRPDFANATPRWHVRNPLETFPAPAADPDSPCCDDVIFGVKRSLAWLRKRYDVDMLRKPSDCSGDALFEVIEYIDCDDIITAVVGRHEEDPYHTSVLPGGRDIIMLEKVDNRAGRCTAVVPGRINLDHRRGQYDDMLGMYQTQARLFALELIAVEQGVFPDEWLVARPNETPEIIKVADGRKGEVGMVRGGDLRQQNQTPGQQTYPTMDRLERAQRLDAGVPADFGGESASNVRTGRRGENIMSATIDFTLQQAQRVLQASMEVENAIAIAVDKGYHDTSKSFYVGWHKDGINTSDYKPSDLWDSDQNIVSYSAAGTDVNGLVVSGGQRVGQGTMSKLSFMEIDPLIEDPETEMDRITSETLMAAMGSSIMQQAASGQIPPHFVARIARYVKDNKMELAEAVEKVQKEAQEEQAAQAPPDAPEAMPGIAMPGTGAEAAPMPEATSPSLEGLSGLLSNLRRPQALTAPGEAPRPEVRV